MTPIGARALVVDDQPVVADILALILGRAGYEVDIAASGAAALRWIEQHRYDLLLCDLRMPELDGPGLFRVLERSRPDLVGRLVFVTGNADDPAYEQFLKDAARPVVSKPFSIAAILRAAEAVRGA